MAKKLNNLLLVLAAKDKKDKKDDKDDSKKGKDKETIFDKKKEEKE
jgi:hypothetical protein